jgi:ATP-dependent DNA ligase I
MLLAELVATSQAVTETAARNGKVALIAELLGRLDPAEAEIAVALLSGEPRQGRIGVGWATAYRHEVAPASVPSIEIAELDEALDRILATTGPGSVEARGAILLALFSRATADEAGFIRRLFTGEMRQGALDGVVTEAVARAADVPSVVLRRAAMLSGDLGRTAGVALRDGEEGLERIGLEVLRPVQPMLAATSDDVTDALAATGLASVEWKLDGIRIQVHRRGEDVRVFTRNLNDITERVPGVVADVMRMPAERLVLDGEAIALDAADRPALFKDTISSVGRTTSVPEVATTAFYFDVLHADGEDLIDRPLAERLDVLERIAGPRRIPGALTADPAEAQAVLDRALAAGHEGAMVKALSSTYQAGRRGKAWRKVKPVRTLDLVVIAVEWGHGRRRGWLSNIHMGARGADGGFVMVGKTFKGMTDEMLRWQTERFSSLERARHGITVELRPEQVVEIALDGVQASPRYPGGVALRFARVLRYRDDKTPEEADTIETVRSMLPGP